VRKKTPADAPSSDGAASPQKGQAPSSPASAHAAHHSAPQHAVWRTAAGAVAAPHAPHGRVGAPPHSSLCTFQCAFCWARQQ